MDTFFHVLTCFDHVSNQTGVQHNFLGRGVDHHLEVLALDVMDIEIDPEQ